MVFCGVTLQGLEQLADGGGGAALDGRAATRTLLAQHGTGPDEEEADYLAQSLASLDSLLLGEGPRVVVALDAERAAVTVVEEAIGHIRLDPADWGWATAVFVDEPQSAPALAAARAALAGHPGRVGEPGLPAPVTELLEDHPLLWFLPTELPDVLALHR